MYDNLAYHYLSKYNLHGDPETLFHVLSESFRPFAASQYPGLAEYYAARDFIEYEEYNASAKLMVGAWQHIDLSLATKEAITEFSYVTEKILQLLPPRKRETLSQVYQQAIKRYREGEKHP